jgi:secondary thiamine-phosphate synthase enzyme
MKVISEQISLKTKGEVDIVDITAKVEDVVKGKHIRNGLATIFVPGSTAALTTIEYEPGLLSDFPTALEKIAPRDAVYEHERRWRDGNGHSHVRASLLGPSLTVPIVDGRLTLGTWQQLVLVELDTRSRSRDVVVQIIGE